MSDAERIAKMPRKEINTEVAHLWREQEEYALENAALRARIAELEAENAALKGRAAELEAWIDVLNSDQ